MVDDLAFYLALGFTMVPMLGLFGNQAGRLLRQIPWDKKVLPDKNNGLIQVMGATGLAEELYAMFDDDIPLTHNAPITLNQAKPPGGIPSTPLTINNGFGGNAIDLNGGSINIGGDGGITLGDGGSITVGDVVITGGGITVGGEPIGGGGGGPGPGTGTTSFLGRIVSGSGSTYEVDLFGNGSGQDATATVTATVPQIDPDEQIPAGTWVGPVFRFGTTYEFQPPIWLS